MFELRAVARLMLIVFVAQLLAVNASAHAFADRLAHEQSHLVMAGSGADSGSDPATQGETSCDHSQACHTSYHLQAFVSPMPVSMVFKAEPRAFATAPTPGLTSLSQFLFRPPRQALPA